MKVFLSKERSSFEVERTSFVEPSSLKPVVLTAILALTVAACHRTSKQPEKTAAISSSSSEQPNHVESTQTSMVAVRFLEDRVKGDPDDFVALNKLSAYYLQLHRETADTRYLELALHSSHDSLQVLGADQNLDGLITLAQAQFQTHDFVSARDHAREFLNYRPNKGQGYQLLGDALLELGDYEQAADAYERMQELDRGSITTESRLARLAMLHGDLVTAQRRYELALRHSQEAPFPSSETIAWCQWQLGELAFGQGEYASAEHHYRDALASFPNYSRAVASLGRVRAAVGDFKSAIEQFEQAVRIIPDPQFIAALGDLYKLTGRKQDAIKQYVLVEKIGHLTQLNGALYSRQINLFRADHDQKSEEAYESALKEAAVRRDIYGADAVAWTALKAGRISEAQMAIKEALRLGTKDARLYYHAGMIARAAGDSDTARDYLRKAMTINPQFDPLQAQLARTALDL